MSLSSQLSHPLFPLPVNQVSEGNIQLAPRVENPRPEFLLKAWALADGRKDNSIPVFFNLERIPRGNMKRLPKRLR